MKHSKKWTAWVLALALLAGLVPAALASEAMGEDLKSRDTLLHRETQLSTNVFWSTAYNDLRTENLITYRPGTAVTPIVTYGGVLTERTSVADAARALEAQGWRVVAGVNGDFYNTGNGLPVGVVITDGVLRSSDAGYYAVGFRADGTALLGKPGIKAEVSLGYAVDTGDGGDTVLIRRSVAGINKARVNTGGIYLYTWDFNTRHTTGTTDPGVNVVCTVTSGKVAVGQELTARVEAVYQESDPAAVSIGENQIALSANAQSNSYYVDALRNTPVGAEVRLTISAEPGWEDVRYAVGALYSLVENGALRDGLPTGVNPRTAIGQKADGTLIFYTMDGRRSGYSVGCSLSQVGERLMELGCVSAVGLDGGGSTNLALTLPSQTAASIYNRPSENNRRVTNQIFLVASNRPSGVLDHFHLGLENDYVLAGSTVGVTVTAVDTHYIPMKRDYTLRASAGTITDDKLTTPREGGDVTVTASGGGSRGQAVVHAVADPSHVALNINGTALTALTVTPGSRTVLTPSAAWNHISLKADAGAFTWTVSGNIGSVDENGVFTAGAPGSGSITAAAGGKSVTLPVTVSRIPLQTVEGFETEFAPVTDELSAGTLTLSRSAAEGAVRYGRSALRLDYRLAPAAEPAAQGGLRAWTIPGAYQSVNLWVRGDGSGNELLALTGVDETPELPLCTLDFTGWEQLSLLLPASVRQLTGFCVRGQSETVTNEETGEEELVLTTPAEGTVYIDQLVAAFPGTVDTEPPAITLAANTDEERGDFVTAEVSDAVDGILPAASVTLAYNGAAVTEGVSYDAATGTLTFALPPAGESREAIRLTVTARDGSGNIGRASLDLPPVGVAHKFKDTKDYWAADYTDFLYNAGVTLGYSDGTFRPNQNVSRAQFAVMLYRYLGLRDEDFAGVELPFADLEQIGEYARPAVRALYSMGVINGNTVDGKLYFFPNNPLTRAQASAMIGRTMEKGYVAAELNYTDGGKIPGYAAPHIQTMTALNILGGYNDGTFRPGNPLTRGQMAKILYFLM